jgi:hypothetical protein
VSSGFGRIMTEQLLARGDRVADTVRDLSVIDGLKAEYGDWLCLTALELSEIALIRGAVDRVVTEQRQPVLSDRRCGTIHAMPFVWK